MAVVVLRLTATVPVTPGITAMSFAVRGPLNGSLPSENCNPAVFVLRSKRRTAPAPFRATYIVCRSSDWANLFGSLPTTTGVPTVAVTGSTGAILLPTAPALLGILAYNDCFEGL